MKKKFFAPLVFLFITIFLFCHTVFCQTVRITGTVTDEKGFRMQQVNVLLKGKNTGVVTDEKGHYTISNAHAGDTLVFSFIGYSSETLVVKDKMNAVNISLVSDVSKLNDVVVVGYGTNTRKEITGAVTSVKATELNTTNAVSIDNLLQGKAAGLTITSRSAQPGGGLDINLRGNLSPNGSNTPLFVIDGVPITSNWGVSSAKVGPNNNNFSDGADQSPLSNINPADIESIDILKDASATAIYGSAAANGVILITTKKGKAGKTQVSYNVSYSLQNLYKNFDMLNATDFMEGVNYSSHEQWLFANKIAPYGTNDSSRYTPAQIFYTPQQIANAGAGYNHSSEIMRQGSIQDHNISFSGGNEKTKYYASLNYFDQLSLLKTTGLKRYTGRINLDQNFNSWLKLSINTLYTDMTYNNPSTGGGRPNPNEARQTNAAFIFDPSIPLMDSLGNLNKSSYPLVPNPLIWNYIEDVTHSTRVFFAPNLEVKFSDVLKVNLVAGVDKTSAARSVFSPTIAQIPEQTTQNYGGFSNNENDNYSAEAYITYNNRFKEVHHLSVTVGSGYYSTQGNSYQMTIFNLPFDALNNNNLGTAPSTDLNTFGSNKWGRTKISEFARANYSFKEKYNLTVTERYDGSSVFSENKKWGLFPAVSGSWLVNQENFLKNNHLISNLKIRASYGATGNESVMTNYYWLSQFGPASGYIYYFGNHINTGIVQTVLGNQNLTWETDITANIGFDFGLFKNRLTGSFDYFIRTAKNLLDFSPLPSNSTNSQIAKNVGSTRSKGLELGLKGSILKTKSLNISSYLNLGYNRANWVERDPLVQLAPWIGKTDLINEMYGWKTTGLFKSLADVQNWTSNGKVLQPGSFPGNIKYIDVKKDGVLDANDVVKLGANNPVNFGFGFNVQVKSFEVNVGTYGMIGMKTYDGWGYYASLFNLSVQQNTDKQVKDVWSSKNPNGTRPGLANNPTDSNNPSGSSDWTLQTTNYLRLKNITFGYYIPETWLQKKHIGHQAKVFIDLQNIGILTNYKGLDPEMEYNASPFPIPFTFAMGLNVNF